MLFWPDLESRRDLAGSCQIWTRSRRDLAESYGISNNLSRRTSNTTGFCKFSLKILRISPEVFGFMIGSGGSGFGGGNPPTDPKGVGFCGRRPATDVGMVGSGGFQFRCGQVAQVGRFPRLAG